MESLVLLMFPFPNLFGFCVKDQTCVPVNLGNPIMWGKERVICRCNFGWGWKLPILAGLVGWAILITFHCEVGHRNQINKISHCSSRTPWSTAAFIATVWKLDQAFHSTVARKFVAPKNYPSCKDITPPKHTQQANQLLKTKRNCPAISQAGEIKSNLPRDVVPTRPTKRFSIFQPLLGFPDVFYGCVPPWKSSRPLKIVYLEINPC